MDGSGRRPPPSKNGANILDSGSASSGPGSPEEGVPAAFLKKYQNLLAKLNDVADRKDAYKQELLNAKQQLEVANFNETELIGKLRELEAKIQDQAYPKVEVIHLSVSMRIFPLNRSETPGATSQVQEVHVKG